MPFTDEFQIIQMEKLIVVEELKATQVIMTPLFLLFPLV